MLLPTAGDLVPKAQKNRVGGSLRLFQHSSFHHSQRGKKESAFGVRDHSESKAIKQYVRQVLVQVTRDSVHRGHYG